MADDLRRLLDHIVHTYVAHDEMIAVDLDASASDRAEDIAADKRRAVRREASRAETLAGAFVEGLERAFAARGRPDAELILDDRDPEQDAMADALIRFLVSHQLASSRSEETEPYHYRYAISIDWDRLAAVATDAGIDLESALRRARSA
ncbi:MAG TPA: hypothetical protein VIL01_10190 [Thermomicrobiales bacterium]